MFDAIISAFTGGIGTGLFGVLSGLVGGIVTSVTNYKMTKLKMAADVQKHTFERDMLLAETAAMTAENEAGIRKVQAEGDAKEKIAEAEAYKQSQMRASKPLFHQDYMNCLMSFSSSRYFGWLSSIAIFFITIGFAFVDMIKHSTRPALTMYTIGLATWISWIAWQILQTNEITLTPEQAYKIFMISVQTIWYLAVTSFTWWFCDRRTAKFLNKQLEGLKL